ncbi:hypothetical protein HDU98_000830 [Podochytrium sp. JEL0797]|nr:hypothetical protein HDU98_000830 [Podochytrium sp. JEL0797]
MATWSLSSSFYIHITGSTVLAPISVVSLIMSLVTICVAGAAAKLLLASSNLFGAGHFALIATQDSTAVGKIVIRNRKKPVPARSKQVGVGLACLIGLVALATPFISIGLHQALLRTLDTGSVTVYPSRTDNTSFVVRGDGYFAPYPMSGVPLISSDQYPSASAGAVSSNLATKNTVVIQAPDMTPYNFNQSQGSWRVESIYRKSSLIGLFFVDVTQEPTSTTFDTKVHYISPLSNYTGM